MQLLNDIVSANSKPRKGELNYLLLAYILITMVNFII